MNGAEICGEKPSPDKNVEKWQTTPIVLTSDVNHLSLQKD
jgi:hypothetical protein